MGVVKNQSIPSNELIHYYIDFMQRNNLMPVAGQFGRNIPTNNMGANNFGGNNFGGNNFGGGGGGQLNQNNQMMYQNNQMAYQPMPMGQPNLPLTQPGYNLGQPVMPQNDNNYDEFAAQ